MTFPVLGSSGLSIRLEFLLPRLATKSGDGTCVPRTAASAQQNPAAHYTISGVGTEAPSASAPVARRISSCKVMSSQAPH